MRKALLLLLASLSLPAIVFAATSFQPDITVERSPFSDTQLGNTSVTDAAGDLTVFGSTNALPPVTADLKEVTVAQSADGWHMTFVTAKPIPQDPALSLNFAAYLDRPDQPNAPDGVFRAQSDLLFYLLFGTRTKWHVDWWTYAPATKRWTQQTAPLTYTVTPAGSSLVIPYAVLPKDTQARVRFSALTSTGGITAVDLAPGEGLPAPSPVTDPTQVSGSGNTADTSPGILIRSIAAIVVLSVAVFIVIAARRRKKNR